MPDASRQSIKLFYCYAHEDRVLRDQLEKRLSGLKRYYHIVNWHDREILPGQDWERAIDEQLNSADIIFLLISPDFMASDYCYGIEMQHALQRHKEGNCLVIPILLRPTHWEGEPFGRLQLLPTDARPITRWPDRDEAFQDVAKEVSRAIKALLWLGFPNNNLPAHSTFLGHQAEINRLFEGLSSTHSLISIEGFPGVGKTSLAIQVGHACLPQAKPALPQPFNFVVWISAMDRPEQQRLLNDVLEIIALIMKRAPIAKRPLEQLEDKKFEVDHLLRTERVLVIIDNFDTIVDPDLIKWIEKVPEPSKVLITSRTHQSAWQRIWTVELRGLKDSEALAFIRQEAKALELAFIEAKTVDELISLARRTGGNPRAIEMSLGCIKGGNVGYDDVIDQLRVAGPAVEAIFNTLFDQSWRLLSEKARRALLVVPLFASSFSKESWRAASGLTASEFEKALLQLVSTKLISVNNDGLKLSCTVHPLTRSFAMSQWNGRPTFEADARIRWSSYFLEFVRKNVVRAKPQEPYWNVLISDKMMRLDAEWPNINEVLAWADQKHQDQLLMDLVMLLVHYMDSRFYNVERITYVKKVIQAAHKMHRKEDEALLRIDALSWTYVEEGLLEKADREIKKGLEIVKQISDDNENAEQLLALGLAWQARVRIEQGNSDKASQLIQSILPKTYKPWIQFRINMVAGDIALKQGKGEIALTIYEKADKILKAYGDEGHGYQIRPRIGMAYLATGKIEMAEKVFVSLGDYEQIAIGKLYAMYGEAFVAYKKGEIDQARRLASAAEEELNRRTTSNLLLKLIKKLYENLDSGYKQSRQSYQV
jgi:LuxR family transcriptional regulator, glucitol operon activator